MRHKSPQSTGRGIMYPNPEALKRRLASAALFSFLGGSALFTHILVSHDMGADGAPVRAVYPAEALVYELQGHGEDDFQAILVAGQTIQRPYPGIPGFLGSDSVDGIGALLMDKDDIGGCSHCGVP